MQSLENIEGAAGTPLGDEQVIYVGITEVVASETWSMNQ